MKLTPIATLCLAALLSGCNPAKAFDTTSRAWHEHSAKVRAEEARQKAFTAHMAEFSRNLAKGDRIIKDIRRSR